MSLGPDVTEVSVVTRNEVTEGWAGESELARSEVPRPCKFWVAVSMETNAGLKKGTSQREASLALCERRAGESPESRVLGTRRLHLLPQPAPHLPDAGTAAFPLNCSPLPLTLSFLRFSGLSLSLKGGEKYNGRRPFDL